MAEYSDYIEGRNFVVGALTGLEKMAGSKNGTSQGWTVQQVADLANASASLPALEVNTAGATITLTFGSGIASYQRQFYGNASFDTPKTIALASDTNANHFTLIFEITDVAATLTFPSGFKSGDSRYNFPSALMFTSDEIGIFKVTGDYDGTSWYIDFSPLPYV